MQIARKLSGSNQIVTPQSTIVAETGVDKKSTVSDLEKINASESAESTENTTGNDATGNAKMLNDWYVKKIDYLDLLKVSVARAYINGPLTLGYLIGIRTPLMAEVDKESILVNIIGGALAWYGTYGLFKGKKFSLLYILGGIGIHYFKLVKVAKE